MNTCKSMFNNLLVSHCTTTYLYLLKIRTIGTYDITKKNHKFHHYITKIQSSEQKWVEVKFL